MHVVGDEDGDGLRRLSGVEGEPAERGGIIAAMVGRARYRVAAHGIGQVNGAVIDRRGG